MTHRQRRRILVASYAAATALMVAACGSPHAIMVPDAGAEDFKDPRSRRGASHSRVAPKAVARQQPQELGLV